MTTKLGPPRTLEEQLLWAHVAGRSRTWVLAHPEAHLTPEQEQAFEAATRQLEAGTPLPYILGHWEFFGLDFIVSPETLIPRPETELLIETALGWVRSQPQPGYRFIDIGTGSGIIPVSLAVHVPSAEIVATDISPAALAIARQNAESHGVEQRIHFIQADLLPAELPPCDILTANLPYIPTETLHGLEVFGREPTLALDGGPDGLTVIGRLFASLTAAQARVRLLLLEFEAQQGPAIKSIAREHFPAAALEIKKDLAGHDRLLIVQQDASWRLSSNT